MEHRQRVSGPHRVGEKKGTMKALIIGGIGGLSIISALLLAQESPLKMVSPRINGSQIAAGARAVQAPKLLLLSMTTNSIVVEWEASDRDVESFEVLRKSNMDPGWTFTLNPFKLPKLHMSTQPETVCRWKWIDKRITPGVRYEYSVRIETEDGESAYSDPLSGVVGSPAPNK